MIHFFNKKYIKFLKYFFPIKIGHNRNFTKTVNGDKGTVTVEVNPKFYFVPNELTSNFTRFELKKFIDLKSKYSKECYRRLKQFRSKGLWTVEIE